MIPFVIAFAYVCIFAYFAATDPPDWDFGLGGGDEDDEDPLGGPRQPQNPRKPPTGGSGRPDPELVSQAQQRATDARGQQLPAEEDEEDEEEERRERQKIYSKLVIQHIYSY